LSDGIDETDVASASSSLFQPAYVSAVEHPQHFWMQMLSDRSTQLDTLISEMTSFYETQVMTMMTMMIKECI